MGSSLVPDRRSRSTFHMSLKDSSSDHRARAVDVKTPARLHLGMLSFGVPDIRAYGGVGVMIDRPGVHLRMTRGRPATGDRFPTTGPLADRTAAFARACVEAWRLDDDAACTIEVVQESWKKVGL